MRKLPRIFLLMMLFCMSKPLKSDVVETTSIEVVKRYLESSPPDTLVFVDIDDTIITPKANMFRSTSPYKRFIDELKQDKDKIPAFDKVLSTWRLKRKVLLTATEWPRLITEKANHGHIYALTQVDGGRGGLIPSIEDWRIKEMASLGIYFTPTYLGKSELTILPPLPQSKHPFLKGAALFYKGIFISGAHSKGAVIRKVIAERHPARIVFIDDRKDHILDVEKVCADEKVPYVGITFRAVDLIKGPLDERVVSLQKTRLLTSQEWLEDEEALALLRE